jgi:hypothetical protein
VALIAAIFRAPRVAVLFATALISGGMARATASTDTPSRDTGQSAYRAGHYREARALWAPRAAAGDPAAELGLGEIYDFGEGVPRDARAAYHWYRQAAQAGLVAAAFDVAVMCDTGDGRKRDPAEAALWYARAAARGDHRAQYNLGMLYETGDGVPRNLAIARAWFRAAAALPAAGRQLAQMHGARHATLDPDVANGGDVAIPGTMLRPAHGTTIESARDDPSVALVWSAPAQTAPVRFFVQVLALVPGTPPREVFATYADRTAVLAPLPSLRGRYAWRVYAVTQNGRGYAASDWARFQVRAVP